VLDDNVVVLQNMMGNRFISSRRPPPRGRPKLAATRSTLDARRVARGITLGSIFLASEDIREQLPEDAKHAKHFDAIDAALREQMTRPSASR